MGKVKNLHEKIPKNYENEKSIIKIVVISKDFIDFKYFLEKVP